MEIQDVINEVHDLKVMQPTPVIRARINHQTKSKVNLGNIKQWTSTDDSSRHQTELQKAVSELRDKRLVDYLLNVISEH